MASRIQILPEDIANKIAAGEVVERPASVVKELIENAIDAGSSRISVEIKSGGKQLIRVTDNGSGMSREDATLAFNRHATSKISTEDDLYRISTFGFRGEALPSIASVSRVELTTNTPDGVAGTRIRIEGGELKDVEDVGRASGTTVTVSGLFYNVPARRKFLRGADTEQRHVANALTTTALAYPEIGFFLTSDGREALSLPAVTNTHARSRAVMGDTLMNQMIPVTFEDNFIQVTGFICRPDAARIARTNQHLFVNLRPVTSRTLNHAVYEGYGSLLPKDRFPITILYLTIDLDEVDVNVHPSKREVRFSNDAMIYDRMMRAVRLALQSSDIVPVFQTDTALMPPAHIPGGAETGSADPAPAEPVRKRIQIDLFNALNATPDNEPWVYSAGQDADSADVSTRQNAAASSEPDHAQAGKTEMIAFWQLHNTYLFAQIKGGMVIIDQHAAHERILYEKALENMRTATGEGQQLLFPISVDLTMPQFALVREYLDVFNRLGFALKMFGGQTVVIEASPAFIRTEGIENLFRQMLDELSESPAGSARPEERLALALASRASIHRGDTLSQEEMNALINELFATSMPHLSPRGQAIIIRMSLEEIQRKFARRS